jgi:hypothetical protein
MFTRVSYCSEAAVINWSCGEACDALPGVKGIFAGGGERLIVLPSIASVNGSFCEDDTATPGFYVAYDAQENTIVVSHQGTNTKNL